MSWICSHQINDKCIRLKKPCQPLQRGCVLEGKATFIDNQLDREHKKDFKKDVCSQSLLPGFFIKSRKIK